MAFIQTTCPHCGANKVPLHIVQAKTHKDDYSAKLWMFCANCEMPLAGIAESFSHNQGFNQNTFINETYNLSKIGWKLVSLYPVPPKPLIPDHIPAETKRALEQAEDNFTRRGNEEAAGIMYRKALETALKNIAPDGKGMLGKRIADLVETGKLVPEIGEWAHEVKAIGNEATHELEAISRDDLEDLRNFTELVLRYLFTLPGMIQKRRKVTNEDDTKVT